MLMRMRANTGWKARKQELNKLLFRKVIDISQKKGAKGGLAIAARPKIEPIKPPRRLLRLPPLKFEKQDYDGNEGEEAIEA